MRRLTFIFPELIESFEAHRVIDVVGLEGDSEELAIRVDLFLGFVLLYATISVHLSILQVDVEIGKLNVIALSVLGAPKERRDSLCR
jgi:hypothetical protein